jgi:phytoene synthase
MALTRTQQPAAAAVMANSGKTFFQAARLLPRGVRDRVVALYAFCRYVDDLADESTQSVELRSRQLAELQQSVLRHQDADLTGASPVLAASLNLSLQSRGAAAVLVGAAREDLRQKQPATEVELIAYAFGVAGTVGLMMADVLGAREQGFRAALELGIAMQWIGSEEVARALTQHDEHAGKLLVASTLRLLTLADAFYDSAYTGFWTLPLRVRWSILAAALCYREIGVAVGKNVQASWRRRTVVTRWRKLALIAIAGLRLLLPRYWRPQDTKAHERETGWLEQVSLAGALAEAIKG